MDFNTFLLRLGIDSENFENKAYEPVKTPEGFIYEVQQRKDIRTCPYCQCVPTKTHTLFNRARMISNHPFCLYKFCCDKYNDGYCYNAQKS